MVIENGVLIVFNNDDLDKRGRAIIPKGVTSIGDQAFLGCSSLTKLVIPKGVTNIEKGAFFGCSSLTKLVIPEGATSIEEDTFSNCSRLTELVIPKGITSIGNYAFENCDSLSNLVIPEWVVSIGFNVFSNCSSLVELVIPEGITSIENGAFKNCDNLKKIIHQGKEYDIDIKYLSYGNIESLKESLEKYTKFKEKGFIPSERVFRKIPYEGIDKFDKKVWFKLAREPVFNIKEENKMALVELAYVMGIFDKELVEIRGKEKNIKEVTDEERRSGQVNDARKRLEYILGLVHKGKLNNENLHAMFDGMKMEYDAEFYKFFRDNEEEILSNGDNMRNLSRIQRNLKKIKEKFGNKIPTIEECNRYFAEVIYEEIKEGNEELAKLCHYNGISEEGFRRYQELYEKQKERREESSIPQVEGKGYIKKIFRKRSTKDKRK